MLASCKSIHTFVSYPQRPKAKNAVQTEMALPPRHVPPKHIEGGEETEEKAEEEEKEKRHMTKEEREEHRKHEQMKETKGE
mmetsp:Transcript_33984/g.85539  ORF Transcript_33984/g.85539 Transcript_33984/m.85539 type:complete len:81 (+) Transcript_33984:520-762(+)